VRIKVYGCRGSVPIAPVGGSYYGGNTSCMVIKSSGRRLVVDAGSGLMQLFHEAYTQDKKTFSATTCNILLSHLHYDHMIGLGTFQPSWKRHYHTNIYTCSRDKRSLKEQVIGHYRPPNWPYDLQTACKFVFKEVVSGVPFYVEHFTVTPFWANHPDMTQSFHITDGHKTVVYLLDSEIEGMDEAHYNELLAFCRGVDLVVFDAAYAVADYPRYKGWGHSTINHGITLARACTPKRMLFSHFAQHYSDAELDAWANLYANENGCEFIMARDGLELRL